jgi:hypothetical protein
MPGLDALWQTAAPGPSEEPGQGRDPSDHRYAAQRGPLGDCGLMRNGVGKHRRLAAVADQLLLRRVLRQAATVVFTTVAGCMLVAGLISVVLASLDSAKHSGPSAPPPVPGQAAAGATQPTSYARPTPPTQGASVGYYPTRPVTLNQPTSSTATPSSPPRPTGSPMLTPPAPKVSSSVPSPVGSSDQRTRHPRLPTSHRTKTRPPFR